MERLSLPSVPLSRVDPLSHGFKVRVKFDRPFKSEWMRSFGPNRSPVKELVSMDVVLYDEEPTAMIFRLITEDQRDRLSWLFHEGREFYLCNPDVENGGHGIHDEYHLVADYTTQLWPIPEGPFPPLPYNIKSCADIALDRTPVNGLFDIVGFCRIANPTTFMKNERDWEPEMRLVIGVYLEEQGWLGKASVICILRGAFVEEVADLIDPKREEPLPPPFVHLRYVRMEEPYDSGTKVVSCLPYASRMKINPDIPKVQLVKKEILDLDFID